EEEVGKGFERFIFEPSKERVAEMLLPRYVETSLYSAMLESMASEQGARMIAMRNATENAEEMISDLTLTYNKARQASITKELLEIVSGAEALRAG
ncbi:MAG: F0F1 ATP synthase subunit gamma, partial [Candidatus Hydrogenedentota bacterium]